MNSPDSAPDEDAGPFDLLSAEEEGVLSSLRAIVEGVRGRGLSPELEAVSAELVSTCAATEAAPGESGTRVFRQGGASFSLRQIPGPGRGIEVSFGGK